MQPLRTPGSDMGASNTFVREMRLAAAAKWYELGELSQGRATEVAGVTRAEFLAALAQFKVSAFQYTAEELDLSLPPVS